MELSSSPLSDSTRCCPGDFWRKALRFCGSSPEVCCRLDLSLEAAKLVLCGELCRRWGGRDVAFEETRLCFLAVGILSTRIFGGAGLIPELEFAPQSDILEIRLQSRSNNSSEQVEKGGDDGCCDFIETARAEVGGSSPALLLQMTRAEQD